MEHKYFILTKNLDYEPSAGGLGYELFEALKRNADKISQYIHETGEVDTYGSLLQRSIRTAMKMKCLGVKQNDIISMCSTNHINSSVPFIASMFLGATVASLDLAQPHNEKVHLLNLVTPTMIFVHESCEDDIEKALKEANLPATIIIVFGETGNNMSFEEFLQPQQNEDMFEPVKPNSIKDTAVISFSSGTTNLPKAISMSHYSILTRAYVLMKATNFDETFQVSNFCLKGNCEKQVVFLHYSTLYWNVAVVMLFRAAFTGAIKLVRANFVADEVCDLIEKYKVDWLFTGPSSASSILNTNTIKNYNLTTLKLIILRGSKVPRKIMDDLNTQFPNVFVTQEYGQTEIGLITGYHIDDEKDIEMQKRKPLSCGRALEGNSYKVVDPETENILGPNEKGELRLKGVSIMNGYRRKDSSLYYDYDSDGWLKTGDIVYYDEDKSFFMLHRIKEVFKYKSTSIVPSDIEEIIMAHPGVKQVAVFGTPYENDGEVPTAVVVLKDKNVKIQSEEIEQMVESKVDDNQRLRGGVRFVEKLPTTPSGKVLRRELREMILSGKI